MTKKSQVIDILKKFEQTDYKKGGVSIAPEMYDAISEHIVKIFDSNHVTEDKNDEWSFCVWCLNTGHINTFAGETKCPNPECKINPPESATSLLKKLIASIEKFGGARHFDTDVIVQCSKQFLQKK